MYLFMYIHVLLICLRSLNVLHNMILGAFVSYNIRTMCMNMSCIVRMYIILSACLTFVYASVRKKTRTHMYLCVYKYTHICMYLTCVNNYIPLDICVCLYVYV